MLTAVRDDNIYFVRVRIVTPTAPFNLRKHNKRLVYDQDSHITKKAQVEEDAYAITIWVLTP